MVRRQAIARTVREVAAQAGAEPAQVALAWVYAQSGRLGVPVVTIPGPRRQRAGEAGARDRVQAVITAYESGFIR